LIAASAQVLYGVLEELATQGKAIPNEVAVSCVDDPALPSFIRPRFTYVEQPGYEMGAAAVEAILAGLQEGEGALSGREFPARLRIGESCGEGVPAVVDIRGNGLALHPVRSDGVSVTSLD
jgi:DNA-binding LacI/PurR family transcriptional regulator